MPYWVRLRLPTNIRQSLRDANSMVAETNYDMETLMMMKVRVGKECGHPCEILATKKVVSLSLSLSLVYIYKINFTYLLMFLLLCLSLFITFYSAVSVPTSAWRSLLIRVTWTDKV